MGIPSNVDSKALALLREAGWLWDGWTRQFRPGARANESAAAYEERQRRNPQVITYMDLEAHGLAPNEYDAVTAEDRALGLTWLKSRIRRAEQPAPPSPPADQPGPRSARKDRRRSARKDSRR